MSRIGKLPVTIPDGVTVERENDIITVKGPKGELKRNIHSTIEIVVEQGRVIVNRTSDEKEQRALHGLYRALINNMVAGVSEGFEKSLEIIGVGYRAEMKSDRIIFTLGYSHPIVLIPPIGISITVTGQIVKISGIDKELVGHVAAKIRSFRPPEPYKGKGIKYVGEYIKRKAGKAAV